MTDQPLPQVQPTSAIRKTWPDLSPRLSALLSDGTPSAASDAIAEIATTHSLRTECAVRLPDLERAARSIAGPEGVMRVVSRIFPALGKPQISEGEWDGWWDDYVLILADLAESALEAARRAILADPDARFVPPPGVWLKLAKASDNPAIRAYGIAKRAMAYQAPSSPTWAEKVRNPTLQTIPAEDRRRLGAEAIAAIKASRAPPLARPAYTGTPGSVDHTGLTREMRVLEGLEREPEPVSLDWDMTPKPPPQAAA